MLGFKCFIFSIFLWLSFGSSQDFNGATELFDNQTEITTSSNDTNHQALIVDTQHENNQANWSFKTFKIPYIHSNYKVKQHNAETYNYKLLYRDWGNHSSKTNIKETHLSLSFFYLKISSPFLLICSQSLGIQVYYHYFNLKFKT